MNSARSGEGRPQFFVFTYHKSGTVLFETVMQRVAARFGWRCATWYGQISALDEQSDVFIIAHSLLGFELRRPFRGVRIIRDPRDIWVSSYLYHQRCTELWCVTADSRLTPPISYPQVDFSMMHRPERWRRDYVRRLGGKSYQQNLRDRDQVEGLAFELAGYTGNTLDAMRRWRALPEVIDVKLEDLGNDFDGTMRLVFRHFGLDDGQCEVAVAAAAAEDVARMDDAALAGRTHIHSRELSKWRRVLSAAQIDGFEARYADLISGLGYELCTPASCPVPGRFRPQSETLDFPGLSPGQARHEFYGARVFVRGDAGFYVGLQP
jgi:hypothetical protein